MANEKLIPISKAKQISKQYNYGYVIIIAWNSLEGFSSWTTYGKDKYKCKVALEVAKGLKEKF